MRKKTFYEIYVKRVLDICCAVAAIAVFWWLYLIIAILVKMKLGSPIVFKQQRPGLNGKIFSLYKFRSMTDERDSEGNLLPDEIRLTKFGKWLRSTSLDELPEAFNILNGSMSLIGPRPLLVSYLPLYNEQQSRRHEVRPGLTGYAQVYGKYNTTPYDKLKLDLFYIENYSFVLDLKLLMMTVKIFFQKEVSEGVNDNQTNALKDSVDPVKELSEKEPVDPEEKE